MRSSVTQLRKPVLLLTGGVILISALFFTGERWNRVSGVTTVNYVQGKSVGVKNLTKKFQVIEFRTEQEANGQRVYLKLKNGYDKNITAFAYSADRGFRRVDKWAAERPEMRIIRPGEIVSEEIKLFSPSSIEKADITIRAVIFEDLSNDGDKKEIEDVFDNRQGLKEQMKRWHPEVAKLIRKLEKTVSKELKSAKRDQDFVNQVVVPELEQLGAFAYSLSISPTSEYQQELIAKNRKESLSLKYALKTRKADIISEVTQLRETLNSEGVFGLNNFWSKLTELERKYNDRKTRP